MIDFEALEKEAQAAEAEAKAADLTAEEQRYQALLARVAEARTAKAAKDRARRALDMATREAAARAVAGGRYLVKGVDLIDCFGLDVAPAAEQLPCGGVIIVRSPEPGRYESMTAEIELKKQRMPPILADLLVDCTVDPPPSDIDNGAKLRSFCDAFLGAASNAAGTVMDLGGLKLKADKRGRA